MTRSVAEEKSVKTVPVSRKAVTALMTPSVAEGRSVRTVLVYPKTVTAMTVPQIQMRSAKGVSSASCAAALLETVTATRLLQTQIASAFQERSARRVSVSPPWPLAASVTQTPPTLTPSALSTKGAFPPVTACSAPNPPTRALARAAPRGRSSTPRSCSSSTPPSPSSPTRTPSST